MCNQQLGAPGRSRTTDTRIFNPLLYQLSYQGKTLQQNTGAPGWIRTTDFTALQAVALDHSTTGAFNLCAVLSAHCQFYRTGNTNQALLFSSPWVQCPVPVNCSLAYCKLQCHSRKASIQLHHHRNHLHP